MRSRDWRFRVEDMLEAIVRIERYTTGMDFAAFAGDEKTVDAVLRNLLIHEYFGVSLDIVWQTVNEDLPPLLPQLRDLLGDASA